MAEPTARTLAVLDTDGKAFAYYPVASIAGAEKLPYSLKVLLENVLRTAPDDDAAALFAQRIVDAGVAGAAGAEVEPARTKAVTAEEVRDHVDRLGSAPFALRNLDRKSVV